MPNVLINRKPPVTHTDVISALKNVSKIHRELRAHNTHVRTEFAALVDATIEANPTAFDTTAQRRLRQEAHTIYASQLSQTAQALNLAQNQVEEVKRRYTQFRKQRSVNIRIDQDTLETIIKITFLLNDELVVDDNHLGFTLHCQRQDNTARITWDFATGEWTVTQKHLYTKFTPFAEIQSELQTPNMALIGMLASAFYTLRHIIGRFGATEWDTQTWASILESMMGHKLTRDDHDRMLVELSRASGRLSNSTIKVFHSEVPEHAAQRPVRRFNADVFSPEMITEAMRGIRPPNILADDTADALAAFTAVRPQPAGGQPAHAPTPPPPPPQPADAPETPGGENMELNPMYRRRPQRT